MKKLSRGLLFLVMVLTVSVVLVGCGDPEYDKAEKEFNVAVKQVKTQVKNKNAAVKEAEKVLKKKEKALEPKAEEDLKVTIEKAKKTKVEIPDIPSETKEVKKKTEELKKVNYSVLVSDINNKKEALIKSRKQYKQITGPSEEFVLSRLKRVKNIKKAEPVNEKTDTNGLLNKQGGYTSAIFFSSKWINPKKEFLTGDVLEDGTDGGGCIEVFKTEKDAQTRNNYLASFDATGALASGSHNVYGTVLIRTSNILPASKQNKLEKAIYDALVKLED